MGFLLGILLALGVAVLAATGYAVWRKARAEALLEEMLSEGRQ